MEHLSLRNQMEALELLREASQWLHDGTEAPNPSRNDMSSREKLQDGEASPSTPKTIAQRARESQLSRLVEILSQTVLIERDLMGRLSDDLWCFIRKDSIELKNISMKMALSAAACQNDKNLKELRVCLQVIVGTLLLLLRDENHLASTGAVGRLMGISVTFPDN